MENVTVGQLDTNLPRFYAEARNKSGESYSKFSLLGFRHAFERYLNAPPLSRGLKLSLDPRFQRSNEMLNAQIVPLKRRGKENVTNKPAIESEDLMRLKTSPVIALSNPLALLRNVWFHVVLFFCRRGREGQRQLKKTSFKFEVDASGRISVTMAHDEATKNHPGGVSDVLNPLALLRNVWFHVVLFFCRRGREGQRQLKKTSFKFEVDASGRISVTMAHDEATKNHPGGVSDVPSSEKLARMHETPEENDGYKALKVYMAKLNPQCDAFFQYPRKNSKWNYDDEVWFDARPIGGNKLDGMMKIISEEAKSPKCTPTKASEPPKSPYGRMLVYRTAT